MEYLHDKRALNHYKNKYNISDIFENDMTEYMNLHLFNKGEYIFRANEKVGTLYFMVEGKAKVFTLLKNGKSLLLRFYKPFMAIGDVEFIDGSTATCNVEAVNTAMCIGISLDHLHRFTINDSVFLKFICRSLGEKLAKNSVSSSINLLYPLENRLSSYILAIASDDKKSPSFDEIYTDKLTEMADLLGASYRHLVRTMNKLSHEGIIKKENNKIIILNRSSLEKLAGDLYE